MKDLTKKRRQLQLLQILANESRISIWKLLFLQDSSIKEFYKLIKELENKRIIKIKKGYVEVGEKGRQIINEARLRNIKQDFTCEKCSGKGYIFKNEDIREKFLEMIKNRPEAEEAYDQGYMQADDVLLRLAFMHERGDLADAEIFIIGDDDLLSVACALTKLPKRVVAVDVDKRIVNFINKISEEHKLSLKAYYYDVCEKLPENFNKRFDVFVSDPVEAIEGIKIFLSRGAGSLKGKGASGYFGLTTLEASLGKWYKIQKLLLRMGFVITDIRRRFSTYPVEEKNFFRYNNKLKVFKKFKSESDFNWFSSAFYRIEAVKEPHAIIKDSIKIGKRFYHDAETWATPEELE